MARGPAGTACSGLDAMNGRSLPLAGGCWKVQSVRLHQKEDASRACSPGLLTKLRSGDGSLSSSASQKASPRRNIQSAIIASTGGVLVVPLQGRQCVSVALYRPIGPMPEHALRHQILQAPTVKMR